MTKRLILCGAACSGKDYLRKKLEEKGFNYSISYTTRPPRDGEIEGKDYFFISKEAALDMIDKDLFYEWVEFNGWIYGTTRTQFYLNDVFIMTPSGIKNISKEDRLNSFIIYINIEESVRRSRLELRNMPGDTVERRLLADHNDFKDFTDFDIQITTPEF